MDIPYRLGAESLGFVLCLSAVNSSAFQQLLVHLLEIHGGQLQQRNTANIGCYMMLDEALIGLVGGRPDFQFCIVLQPEFQPLADIVLSRFCEIQLFSGFQRLLQLFFDFCLGLPSTFL